MRVVGTIFLGLLLDLSLGQPALADKRVVIGNSAYQNVARLAHPTNEPDLPAAGLSPEAQRAPPASPQQRRGALHQPITGAPLQPSDRRARAQRPPTLSVDVSESLRCSLSLSNSKNRKPSPLGHTVRYRSKTSDPPPMSRRSKLHLQ
jgi:hypothetical protein